MGSVIGVRFITGAQSAQGLLPLPAGVPVLAAARGGTGEFGVAFGWGGGKDSLRRSWTPKSAGSGVGLEVGIQRVGTCVGLLIASDWFVGPTVSFLELEDLGVSEVEDLSGWLIDMVVV